MPLLAILGLIGALEAAGFGPHEASPGQAAAVQGRPNVVVIESDDQALKSMRVMDNVNSLIGDQGATFSRHFVNFSLCCPSRATFLTGQYAHNHRVLSNQAPSGGFGRFQSLHGTNNLAIWLRRAGYHTAMIGKYLNQYEHDSPVPSGWSEWHVAPEGWGVYNYPLNENGTLVRYGDKRADFQEDVFTSKAVGLVDRWAPESRPFFLWLTYSAPHWMGPDPNPNPPFNCGDAAKPAPRHADAFNFEPLPWPPNFSEANVSDKPASIRKLPPLSAGRIFDVQRKYRCELESLLSVDEGVEKVVDALRASGELDNTLVIYTSDNGYFHGEHRIPQGKMRIYEESIRVPLQMRGPGIPRGDTVGDLTINADLAPTITDVANVDAGLAMDGRSLIPIARNPGITEGRELLIEEPGPLSGSQYWGPGFEAIRTKRYMYAELRTGEKELYDLAQDPFELRSRHADPAYASIRSQLAARLHKLQNCAGAGCRTHP